MDFVEALQAIQRALRFDARQIWLQGIVIKNVIFFQKYDFFCFFVKGFNDQFPTATNVRQIRDGSETAASQARGLSEKTHSRLLDFAAVRVSTQV